MSRARVPEVADAIHSAAIRLLRMVRVEDAKAGIGPAQLSALSVLVFAGPRTMGELAAAEQVTAPTMSRVVQSLVDRGLVERASHETDRRALRVEPTAKGRKLLLAGRDRRVAALARRLEKLPAAELAVIARAARLISEI
jgi:DNA-binding MarR family transcriptional regulator